MTNYMTYLLLLSHTCSSDFMSLTGNRISASRENNRLSDLVNVNEYILLSGLEL